MNELYLVTGLRDTSLERSDILLTPNKSLAKNKLKEVTKNTGFILSSMQELLPFMIEEETYYWNSQDNTIYMIDCSTNNLEPIEGDYGAEYFHPSIISGPVGVLMSTMRYLLNTEKQQLNNLESYPNEMIKFKSFCFTGIKKEDPSSRCTDELESLILRDICLMSTPFDNFAFYIAYEDLSGNLGYIKLLGQEGGFSAIKVLDTDLNISWLEQLRQRARVFLADLTDKIVHESLARISESNEQSIYKCFKNKQNFRKYLSNAKFIEISNHDRYSGALRIFTDQESKYILSFIPNNTLAMEFQEIKKYLC